VTDGTGVAGGIGVGGIGVGSMGVGSTGVTGGEVESAPDRAICVLLVDEDVLVRRAIKRTLIAQGFGLVECATGKEALEALERVSPDVMLLDLALPDVPGLELLQRVRRMRPELEVVAMTANASIAVTVEAVRAGASDVLGKPLVSHEAVTAALKSASDRRQLLRRHRDGAATLPSENDGVDPLGNGGNGDPFGPLVGRSGKMEEVYRRAMGVAPTQSTVLLLGENGTGKELLARAIHRNSTRAAQTMRTINCGAIPETLVETELFGSVRGAFTGAQDKPGLFEIGDGGTVFLDEVGDLPVSAQVKLLRVLSEGEIKRVGSQDTKHVDVRVIAATNVDLRERIASGRFREDLFYRLNVIPIVLPPLRERREDIALLAVHFMRKYARRVGRRVVKLSPDTMAILERHRWPGNVRELENALEHAVVMTRGEVIEPSDLPVELDGSMIDTPTGSEGTAPIVSPWIPTEVEAWRELGFLSGAYGSAKERVQDSFDRAYVQHVLDLAGGNMSRASRDAGMDRSNFRRLVKKAFPGRSGLGQDIRNDASSGEGNVIEGGISDETTSGGGRPDGR
jgi:two-component system response regulator HydG